VGLLRRARSGALKLLVRNWSAGGMVCDDQAGAARVALDRRACPARPRWARCTSCGP